MQGFLPENILSCVCGFVLLKWTPQRSGRPVVEDEIHSLQQTSKIKYDNKALIVSCLTLLNSANNNDSFGLFNTWLFLWHFTTCYTMTLHCFFQHTVLYTLYWSLMTFLMYYTLTFSMKLPYIILCILSWLLMTFFDIL